MTDTVFTRTALTEAAKKAGVTTDQARTILEAAGVTVQPEKPALTTEPGSVIIATEVRGVEGKWRMFCDPNGDWFSTEEIADREYHDPKHITKWTEAMVVPAGEPIDLNEVRAEDLVRLELDSGDEATFTVTHVDEHRIESYRNLYLKRGIHAVYLLDREDQTND